MQYYTPDGVSKGNALNATCLSKHLSASDGRASSSSLEEDDQVAPDVVKPEEELPNGSRERKAQRRADEKRGREAEEEEDVEDIVERGNKKRKVQAGSQYPGSDKSDTIPGKKMNLVRKGRASRDINEACEGRAEMDDLNNVADAHDNSFTWSLAYDLLTLAREIEESFAAEDSKLIKELLSVIESLNRTMVLVQQSGLVLTASMIQPILANLRQTCLADDELASNWESSLHSTVEKPSLLLSGVAAMVDGKMMSSPPRATTRAPGLVDAALAAGLNNGGLIGKVRGQGCQMAYRFGVTANKGKSKITNEGKRKKEDKMMKKEDEQEEDEEEEEGKQDDEEVEEEKKKEKDYEKEVEVEERKEEEEEEEEEEEQKEEKAEDAREEG
ncbi:unnamed protein product, partial [Protopolystoma xenopodis]